LASVEFRRNNIQVAEDLALKAVDRYESNTAANYLLACIACARKAVKDCWRYFDLMWQYNSEDLMNPESELGSSFRTDPDLAFMRDALPETVEIADSGPDGLMRSLIQASLSKEKEACAKYLGLALKYSQDNSGRMRPDIVSAVRDYPDLRFVRDHLSEISSDIELFDAAHGRSNIMDKLIPRAVPSHLLLMLIAVCVVLILADIGYAVPSVIDLSTN
jgi:hypothetical protein